MPQPNLFDQLKDLEDRISVMERFIDPNIVKLDSIQTLTNKTIDGSQLVAGSVTTTQMESNTWHLVGGAGEPAFQNSWSNYDNGFATCAFMLDKEGVVHLRGLLVGTTDNTVIFTLPTGYRPAFTHLYAISATEIIARIDLQADGDVYFKTGNKGYVSLENITFGIDA